MTKKKKIIVSLSSLGAIAIAAGVIVPTAIACSGTNSATKKVSNNGLINLSYANNNNYASNLSNHIYTQNIFINNEIPTLSLNATLTANNDATLSYDWYSGQISVKNNVNTFDSATSANLDIHSSSFTPNINNTKAGTYDYFCVVTATFSDGQTLQSVSNQYTINIYDSVNAKFYSNSGANNTYTFYSLSNNTYTLNVSDILFNVNTSTFNSSNTPLSYQWYTTSSATPITNVNDLTSSMLVANATSSSYTITTVPTTTVYYYLKVTGYWNNTEFSVLSPQYTVKFVNADSPVFISSNNQLNSMDVLQNETTYQTLTVNDSSLNLTSKDTVTYEWYKNGTAITSATSNSYTLTAADVSLSGINSYSVKLTVTDGDITSTYTSSKFVVNVTNNSLTKATITTIGTSPVTVYNNNYYGVYLIMPTGADSSLPTFELTPTLSNANANNIVYTYTWYFINVQDPSLSNSITTSSNLLTPPSDWISKYKLSTGTTYQVYGTISATLNGANLTTSSANTVTINGTKLTFPSNVEIGYSNFVSIASTSTPTLTVNNISTTSKTPATIALSTNGQSSVTLTSSISFNGLDGVLWTASGSSSSLLYGNTGVGYMSFAMNTLSDVSGTLYTTKNIAAPAIADYTVTNEANGLTTLTYTSSITFNVSTKTLPNLQFTSNFSFNSSNAYTYTSNTAYANIQYANAAQAENNMQYLLSNATYADTLLLDVFNNQINSNAVAFDNNLFSWLGNKVTNNLQVTKDNSTWSPITDYLTSDLIKSGLNADGWGVTISNDYPGYVTYNTAQAVSSSYTNNYMTNAVGFNTVELGVGLNFDTPRIGNHGVGVNNSAYMFGAGPGNYYLNWYSVLTVIWPYNIQTPSSITINSNGAVTLNWAKPNTDNAVFSIIDPKKSFNLYTVGSSAIASGFEGVAFNYTDSFNYSLSSSLFPTYSIA